MKLKKFFHNKGFIAMIVLFLLLGITIKHKENNKTKATFNLVDDNKIIQKDFDGDGVKDILYIKKDLESNKYYIQINTKNKSYQLDANKNLKTLGTYSKSWPMRITIKDLNRDNIPEIILQSGEESDAIQHIFSWDINDFEDILSNKNNLIGFMDLTNNKTPKILSGNFYNDELYLKNYIIINNKATGFNINYPENFLGKATIKNFISFMLGSDSLKENVVSSLEEPLINPIFELKNSGYSFKFQDGIFEDIKCDTKGNIENIQWILNFKCKNDEEEKNITFTLKLRKIKNKDKDFYKIYYFNKQNLID
ncbi:hypothetical protein C3495_03880 [Clostridiaceae bacterium 14S0207]|nr:hypothetical protein C3495_03880 [Clostridiaceae bacterium 14S0207]